jgi:DNA-binding MarR family transcriptional regulator
MLNRKEKLVMSYLYDVCIANGGKCLLSIEEIINNLYSKVDLTEDKVQEIVKNLAFDDYIEVVDSDKKGERVYCITLTEHGQAFVRENNNTKRNTRMLIIRTVLLAVLSFVVGVILKAIFS